MMTIEETHAILTKELADLEYLLASDTLDGNESLVIKSQIMNLRNRLSHMTLPDWIKAFKTKPTYINY